MSDPKTKLAIALARAAAQKPQPNPDGTYGQPPEGYFLNPDTGQMTSRELLKNAVKTSPATGLASGFIGGFSSGSVDEMAGAAGGEIGREFMRAEMEKNADKHPVANTVGSVAGAVLSPIGKALGTANTVRKGVAIGAAYGGAEGFMGGEGGVAERLESAGWGAATGGMFAGIGSSVAKGAHKAVRAAFSKADKRPTVENLRTAKNAAYAAVRKAGVEFDENEMLALSQRVMRRMKVRDFDDIADPQTAASLRILEKRQGPISLNRLDKLRQNMWSRYARSDEPGILDVIAEIDNTIERAAEGNDLLNAARAANKKFAKAEMLEDAFRKAELQTASTGSGGNILNKYRQAVTGIITQPKKAKWFSEQELALMEQFVRGDNIENSLRQAGKLSPGGKGLMTALNVYAAAVDPTLLVVTGAATAAKGAADRSAMKGAGAIQDALATGVIQQPRPSPSVGGAALGSAAFGNELIN